MSRLTSYALKPSFQDLLRPLVARLFRIGVTANQVTAITAFGSVLAGLLTAQLADWRPVFLLIPVWLPARMALDAIDGMLAREFRQRSPLGGYLNEIGGVLSDAALYAPFARVTPFGSLGVDLVIAFSIITEFAGALGPAIGASRRYDGPLGKSDRAVVFGALGLWVGCSARMPAWLGWAMPTVVALLALTAINRVHAGIREAESAGSPKC